tara:strand:- start:461 stop:688 length:228 start_codon:yes stop_codon:yes gene_type:complete
MDLKNLEYEQESPLWHAKNYALIMFYCMGMNFIDLVKLKVKNIEGERLLYGRSKNGRPHLGQDYRKFEKHPGVIP